MKMIFLIIAYLFACVGPVISQGTNKAANNDPTKILFSVKSQDKTIIPSLRKEDVRVFEDGMQQGVLSFQKQSDVPLSIALMVDASASQERVFTRLKTAALLFFGSVTQPGKDMVAVISFTGKPTLEQSLTTDLQQVRKVIEQLKPVQLPADFLEQVKRKQPKVGSDLADMGSTAIWDAVWFTGEEVLAKAPDEKKRVIILITDGVDSSSRKKLSEAIDQATKSKVVIYSIGIGDDKLDLLDKIHH